MHKETLEKRFFYQDTPILYEIMENRLLLQDFPGFVCRKIEYTGMTSDLMKDLMLSAVDAVYTDVEDEVFLSQLIDMGIIVYTVYEHKDYKKIRKFGRTVYTAGGFRRSWISEQLKFGLDKLGGVVGCLICAGLFVTLGPLIKLDSHGPIFFKQERIGLNGRRFMMYKFRTMQKDAEERKDQLKKTSNEVCQEMFKVKNDTRITKIGGILRRTSLDEFPQFWNVLKGDMSIVGTRPPTVDEVALYLPRHKVRLYTKPGITGVWQVSGRSNIKDFEEVIRMDTEYIRRRSPFRYVSLILRTLTACKNKEGE